MTHEYDPRDNAEDNLRELVALREAAQRLCDAYADNAAVQGMKADGHSMGWKAELDAEDVLLCALQDTRTALDGRERPHTHKYR